MLVNSFEECHIAYKRFNGWDTNNDVERLNHLKHFPYSVVVQTAYLENDNADAWCKSRYGVKGIQWAVLWYGKTDYDYGYAEYFFKNEDSARTFSEKVPSFFGIFPTGRWRTRGSGVYEAVTEEDIG